MIFARKMLEFYIIIARKIFFPNFRGAYVHIYLFPKRFNDYMEL